MKRLGEFELDRTALSGDLAAFEALLGDPTKELSERDDILPFFKSHPNLAALVGLHNSQIGEPTLIKTELGIFGDWACDLAVGDKEQFKFCFIEFEPAAADSIFKKSAGKGVPDWSSRLEHGVSQIIDWFYYLDGNKHTPQFRGFFGSGSASYAGLLVIGRDAFLTAESHDRLDWRSQHTSVNGKPIHIVTFDALFRTLSQRAKYYALPLKPARKPRAKNKK